MKTNMKKSISWTVAAIFLAASFVALAAAGNPKTFNGSLQGHETEVFQGPPPGTLQGDGAATGIATHFGQFTLTSKYTVNLADGTASGIAVLVAANGDSIFTTLAALGVATEIPGVFHVVEIHTITGGTGRFANGQGSFTVDRLSNVVTGLTSGTIQGTISSPDAGH